MIVSTYQSVTGTGKAAVEQMMEERQHGKAENMVYHYPIDMNCIPHCDVFLENGYTKEEMKVVHETRKILGDDKIAITSTAVRVPVMGGHSEAVNIEFANEITIEGIRSVLSNIAGLVVQDNPSSNEYPMPLTSHGRDEVFVGRIRLDESLPNTINMWITADNLRKGAATNAIEIMEFLINQK
jgi:aspartate-semialdehyde dehydrogenase